MDTKVLYISKNTALMNRLEVNKKKRHIICMIKNVYVFVLLIN